MRAPNGKQPIRVLHVITGLSRGGAETMLHKLITAFRKDSGLVHSIIALNDQNVFDFDSLGVPVTLANLSGSLGLPGAILQLRRLARAWRPDIVHGWMYHGNVVACLIAPPATPIVAGIRCTLAADKEKVSTRASIKLGSPLLKARNGRVVYCSELSRQQHEAIGYPAENALVIPNGFDCERFKPDVDARGRLLSELGLDPRVCLIGHVARFHPMKNHAGLIRVFSDLASAHMTIHLVMAGRDVTYGNPALSNMINELGLGGRVHLLGERADIHRVVPAFDMYVSSSAWGEAFPNVLGEAMACGVPCVATDVGDSAMIVAETGRIVLPQDDIALARAILEFAQFTAAKRRQLGGQARDRVVREYSLSRAASSYSALYMELA